MYTNESTDVVLALVDSACTGNAEVVSRILLGRIPSDANRHTFACGGRHAFHCLRYNDYIFVCLSESDSGHTEDAFLDELRVEWCAFVERFDAEEKESDGAPLVPLLRYHDFCPVIQRIMVSTLYVYESPTYYKYIE